MLIDHLVKILEKNGDYTLTGICIDCKKDVTINISQIDETQINIEGGAVFEPPEAYGYSEKFICKCDSCFIIDPKIHQRTEVYTRCVGYLRPTSQMNPGKLAEISQRAMFHI